MKNKIKDTDLTVNVAGQIVTNVRFDNGDIVSWFTNNYDTLDLLITTGQGVHTQHQHFSDVAIGRINAAILDIRNQ